MLISNFFSSPSMRRLSSVNQINTNGHPQLLCQSLFTPNGFGSRWDFSTHGVPLTPSVMLCWPCLQINSTVASLYQQHLRHKNLDAKSTSTSVNLCMMVCCTHYLILRDQEWSDGTSLCILMTRVAELASAMAATPLLWKYVQNNEGCWLNLMYWGTFFTYKCLNCNTKLFAN